MKLNKNQLFAGTGRVDITPPANTPLAGFGARDHASEGIHDPLLVTALAMSQGEQKAVILSVDLLGISLAFMDKLYKYMKEQFDLAPAQVMVNFSHTHDGPQVESRSYAVDSDGNPIDPIDIYVETLIPAFGKAVQEALDTARPASVSWGTGTTEIGICRRAADKVYKGSFLYANEDKGEYGILANYPNPVREIDKTVIVVKFVDEDARPIALIFSAPCHPTTLNFSNYLVSAEYPAVTRRILEEDLNGAPALFLQGMGGDIKPRRVAGENRFRGGTFEDVEAVGTELADDVRDVINQGLKPLDFGLKYGYKRAAAPLMQFDRKTYERFTEDDQPKHRQNTARYWLEQMGQGKPIPTTFDIDLSVLQFSPDFRFTGISGELLTFMGWKIKRHLGPDVTFPLGYTGGLIGYIPDSSVIKVGGYEVLESVLLGHERPAPFSEAIDEALLGGYDAILEGMG